MRSAPLPSESCAAAQWRDVEVRYPYARMNAVGPVTLSVGEGERVLLLGPSGSGKSTLLLTLTGLIPASMPAIVSGQIELFGEDVSSRQPWGWASEVAQYFQDADQTLCGMRVEDEIAFPLENRALPAEHIARRVTEAMRQVGLPDEWRNRRSSTLSGGERQLVALAGTLVQDAPLFVADEPTAHLAPEATDRLHALLAAHDRSRSVLIVDHRLDGLIAFIDRVVVLGRDGRIVAEGSPRRIFRDKRELLTSLGIWCPISSELDARLGQAGAAPAIAPLSVAEALTHLDPDAAPRETIDRARPAVEAFAAETACPLAPVGESAPVLTRLKRAECAPFLGPTVLRDIDLAIREGEILGVLGANGAGKSTLGLCLSGLLPLKSGERMGAPAGYAFQRPESQFTAATVLEEIVTALPKAMPDKAAHASQALAAWGLGGFETRHPFELSQGQKRRLVLAALTASDRWPLLVLDEPMAGLDASGVATLVLEILALSDKGRAVAVITHDMDLAMRLCPRSIVVGEGRILADGPTGELMSDPALLRRAGLKEPARSEALRWLQRVASCWKALNPLSKLFVCIVWLAAAMLIFDTRFQLAAIALPALALMILNRTSPLVLLALMLPFALFGFGFLTTSLLFHRESDFALRMAGEALLASPAFSAGLTLFLRALACGMISLFFALSTDPGALVRGLMAHAKLSPRIGYSLFAAMQLVPDLAAEAQQMRYTRSLKSGRRLRRIPGPVEIFSLVIPLLAFAIRRAGRTAIAMEARGLAPAAPRTIMHAPGFHGRDVVFAVATLAALGLCMMIVTRI